jgi:hypothetical protein
LLTNWYYDVDDSSDTENDESESGSGISMEDDSWFYNDDFPALWDLLFCPPLCLPLGRTLIENYSYVVAAPGGGDTYEVGIGWSGYYYLLGLEVDSETPDENCYSY